MHCVCEIAEESVKYFTFESAVLNGAELSGLLYQRPLDRSRNIPMQTLLLSRFEQLNFSRSSKRASVVGYPSRKPNGR